MYIKDLSGDGMIQPVGWLSLRPYRMGWVEDTYRRRLKELLRDPWEERHAMGSHTCNLCFLWRESRNALIPGKGCVYYVPAMIRHYINVHFYKPPQQFLDAVLACPDMGSDEYFDALVANSCEQWSLRFQLGAPCPYCDGQKRTPDAKQCMSCGMAWH